eukprot:scaffold67934_cov17-Prasinocladus_malaysianus.AAC.1
MLGLTIAGLSLTQEPDSPDASALYASAPSLPPGGFTSGFMSGSHLRSSVHEVVDLLNTVHTPPSMDLSMASNPQQTSRGQTGIGMDETTGTLCLTSFWTELCAMFCDGRQAWRTQTLINCNTLRCKS